MHAWEGQLAGHSVYMVVASMGISKDVVDQAIAPAIMKNPRYRWCSDTRAFNEVEVQRRYSNKLPRSVLDMPAGRRRLEEQKNGCNSSCSAYLIEKTLQKDT